MADYVDSLSDAELRTKLVEYGFPVLPITTTTRKVMTKKLKMLIENKNKMPPATNKTTRKSTRRSVDKQNDTGAVSSVTFAPNFTRWEYTSNDTSSPLVYGQGRGIEVGEYASTSAHPIFSGPTGGRHFEDDIFFQNVNTTNELIDENLRWKCIEEKDEEIDIHENLICILCISNKKNYSLQCGHLFCGPCTEKFYNIIAPKCPTCRKFLDMKPTRIYL